MPLAAQRDAQHRRVDVPAVDDDAAPAVRILERGADDAGLAPGELRHRVEQVREAREPVPQRSADLVVGRVGVAGGHDDAGRASFEMMSGVVISGASVTRVRPPRSEVSSPIAPSSSPRSFAGSWTPLRATLRNGPSMWMPSTPGTPASIAARTASSARATTSRSSLMSVGRNPVVPKRRWASPIARIASTVGSALKSTPPPPFTCVSRKPGSSRWPPRSWRTARRHARVVAGDDVDDPAAVEQHGPALDDAVVAEHAAVDECDRHQTVSVTLRRCGGRSGSRPRATASALASR